jgi:hypothetical protein
VLPSVRDRRRRSMADFKPLSNTLKFVEHPKYLVVSAWMRTPDDALRFNNCFFKQANPLAIERDDGEAPFIVPVYMDEATLTYLRSRVYTYTWQPYIHSIDGSRFQAFKTTDTGQTVLTKPPPDEVLAEHVVERRAWITSIYVDMTSGDASRVDLSFIDFLQRYQAQSKHYTLDDDDDMVSTKRTLDDAGDDDGSLNLPPTKRRT